MYLTVTTTCMVIASEFVHQICVYLKSLLSHACHKPKPLILLLLDFVLHVGSLRTLNVIGLINVVYISFTVAFLLQVKLWFLCMLFSEINE